MWGDSVTYRNSDEDSTNRQEAVCEQTMLLINHVETDLEFHHLSPGDIMFFYSRPV